MTRRVLALSLAAMISAAPAGATGVVGRLWLSDEAARAARTGQTPSAAAVLQQRAAREAVVYVERIPEKVERKLARKGWFAKGPPVPRLVQKTGQFTPRILAIPAGSRIELVNLDHVFHNAFSVSPAKRFDLGKYPPGRVDTLEFATAGVVNLHCDIHPEEVGFVVVVPNHAYARPDSAGRFSLPKLPKGSYTVRAWHPARGERTATLVVPRRGPATVAVRY